MEIRGGELEKRPRARPTIARRSCDQCRSRKIGCDRASPCSNCVNARVDCTHSAVASNPSTTPKQRHAVTHIGYWVSLTTLRGSEQKIDDIAEGIIGIKLLLERLDLSSITPSTSQGSTSKSPQSLASTCSRRNDAVRASASTSSSWDQSAHIIDLLRSVIDDENLSPATAGPQATGVVSSLRGIVQALESPSPAQSSYTPEDTTVRTRCGTAPPMPPLEAVLDVLRWVRGRESHFRISRIAQVLPLERFADVCRRVYFALDDYNEVDFVLANGYLAYLFAETLLSSGMEASRGHWQMCRKNLHDAVSRLPLLLPASADVIAALTIAAYDAMENANATAASTFISSAARACITLDYHRADTPGRRPRDDATRRERDSLFWSVYTLDKGLSLQLNRPPNIRDADVTLAFDAESLPHTVKLARIQGQAYERLYSSSGLDRPAAERARDAEMLANRLRELIQETHLEMQNAEAQPADANGDPLRLLYLQCALVCHSSLLTLILRAVPVSPASPSGATDECVAVARLTLDVHQQCMTSIRSCETDPQIVNKYISWAILNIPFVPFSVLFTHAVRSLDAEDDLTRLERFATSLQPEIGDAPGDAATHPHRLYRLLCETARLHIQSARQRSGSSQNVDLGNRPADSQAGDETQALNAAFVEGGIPPGFVFDSDGLGDWYYRNHQLMSLLGSDGVY
ncbi:C6 transcription factor [Colletotrichum musicola]|uniref:C6 transcription factor n=1 Tax=Colletotrichum musicola TaxID=2175873 RepID=A0A8H6U7B4_9PEZI|nr:C6 transcription factor [Colletotrichum musicola]